MTGGPLLPEALGRQLDERTRTARAEVDRLEEAIADLTGRLHEARQLLTRLETTRQMLTELAEHTPPEAAADLPAVYQQILTILARAPEGLRTKDICRALGLPDEPKHTEGTRAKLKRLVGRGLANQPKPGLFTPNIHSS
jgi:chromosome segregation ATPase